MALKEGLAAEAYRHTQTGPLSWLLAAIGCVQLVTGAWLWRDPRVGGILLAVGVVVLLLASMFHNLTVEDEGEELAIRFGPTPLFQKRLKYDAIRSVDIGKTRLIEGLGIHMIRPGVWIWNLWGRDCVIVDHDSGTLKIGTDEPQELARFLSGRIQDTAA